MELRHVLLLVDPSQGHINPALQLAKRLIRMGMEVTFVTSPFAQHCMAKASGIPKGLNLAAFADGYDDGSKVKASDPQAYMSELRKRWSDKLRNFIHNCADQGQPLWFLIYTLLLPWAAEVARECHVPSALLWPQPASVLDIYYYYFNGYEDDIKNCSSDPDCSIGLPGLPLLAMRDLPSFFLPSNSEKYNFALTVFKQHLDALEEEEKPRVLVNTFDALEPKSLKAIEKYNMIAYGPMIPSAFLDGKDPSDKAYCGGIFQDSIGYIDWLNSKPAKSVVFISFGSMLHLQKPQMEEIARGLLESNKPFLWVIREKENGEVDKLSCMEELEQKGMIVPWCSQLEVLTHSSLGCFLTHCRWNSTLESLTFGVPMIAFPQWTDQGTNAKLVQDVWRTGVRVNPRKDGLVDSGEIRRCVELVMDDGEKGMELRRNAAKWKDLAREAVQDCGSSDKNLKAFLQEIGEGC